MKGTIVFEKNHNTAAGIDKVVFEKYRKHQQMIQILNDGEQEIRKLIPTLKNSAESIFQQENKAQIEEAKKRVRGIEQIIQEVLEPELKNLAEKAAAIELDKNLMPIIKGVKSKEEAFQEVKKDILLLASEIKENVRELL